MAGKRGTLAELEATRQDLAAGMQGELAVCKANLDLIAANPGSTRSVVERSGAAPGSAATQDSVGGVAVRIGAVRRCLGCLGQCPGIGKEVPIPWTYPGPAGVQAIAEVGCSFFASLQEGQSLGPLEQAFQAKIPFKYAPRESEMTMAMYGHERVFQGPDQRREIQRHLTLGGGGNCLQVYFEFDEARKKVTNRSLRPALIPLSPGLTSTIVS